MKLLTNSDLDVFEEIIECPKCIVSKNICNFHVERIKNVLIKDAKIEIEKLTAVN